MSDGTVRWAARLPDADSGTVIAGPAGRVVVATDRYIGLLDRSGEFGWLAAVESPLPGPPVVLADGSIARVENNEVVVRDQGAGTIIARLPGPAAPDVVATPAGGLLYGRHTKQHAGVLTSATAAGTIRWSRALSRRLAAPLVTDELIIVGDGSCLRAFDLGGTPMWVADLAGFHDTAAPMAGSPRDEVAGPPLAIGDGLIVAELRWQAGFGLHLFDVKAARVTPIRPPVGVHRPMAALLTPETSPGLAVLGPTGDATWRVVLVDATGRLIWTHESPAAPRELLAGASGDLLITASPPLQSWRQYHQWYDLSDQCFVQCVDRSGAGRWTWRAPQPLTFRSAVTPGGEIVVAAPGRLWAVG